MNLLSKPGTEAAVQVPRDPAAWPDVALETLLRTHPELDGTESSVEVTFANPETQDGEGVVLVRHGEQAAEIPYFVREGHLQPLDIIRIGGEAMPLTKDRLNEYFLNRGSLGVVSHEPDKQRPGGGATAYQGGSPSDLQQAMHKSASLLYEDIVSTAEPEAVKAAIERVTAAQWEAIVAGGLGEVIQALPLDNEAAKVAADAAGGDPAIALALHHRAPGQYEARVYGPSRMDQGFPNLLDTQVWAGEDVKHATEVFGDAPFDVADAHGFAAVALGEQPPPIDEAAFAMQEKVASTEWNGRGTAFDAKGDPVEGYQMVQHRLSGEPNGYALFVGEDGKYASARDVGCIPGSFDGDWPMLLAQQDALSGPARGLAKQACWAWRADDGTFHASEPFALRQVQRTGDAITKIAGHTPDGKAIEFRRSATLNSLAPMQAEQKTAQERTDGAGYYVPESYRLLALGTRFEARDADRIDGDLQSKVAHDLGPRLRITFSGGRYSVEGCGAEKVASGLRSMTHPTMRVLMACCGMGKEAQDEAMARLADSGQIDLRGVCFGQAFYPEASPEPQAIEQGKAASYLSPRATDQVWETIEAERPAYWNIVKIAAQAADQEMTPYLTDTAMSMDVSNKDQMDSLMEALPVLEEAVRMLVVVLERARTEDTNLVPEEVARAMRSLDNIVRSLRGAQVQTDAVEAQ